MMHVLLCITVLPAILSHPALTALPSALSTRCLKITHIDWRIAFLAKRDL